MLTTIGTVLAIVLGIGGVVVSLTTQLNHVSHLKEAVDKIEKWQETHNDKMASIEARLTGIEATCKERHRE